MKNAGAGFLCFLLFISVLIFGVLFTINSTALNPKFPVNAINKINVEELIDEIVVIEDSGGSVEAAEQIKQLIPKIEPLVKERTEVAINSVYDYLLGKRQQPDIRGVIGDSFLNPVFVEALLEDINIYELVEVMMQSDSADNAMPEEFVTAIKNAIHSIEPELKEHTSVIAGHIFAYILRDSQTLDLTGTLRATVLNQEFIITIMDELDLATFTEEIITGQLKNQIPPDMAFLTTYVSDAVEELVPVIKAQFADAADPFLDYILGITPHLSINISLDRIIETLEEKLQAELLASIPGEYAGLTQSELIQLFDSQFMGNLKEFIPSTFTVDETIIGPAIVGNVSGYIDDTENSITAIRQNIDDMATNAEQPLIEARKYASIFQMVYIGFIVLIVLLTAGIILLMRNVKAVTRRIGIPLFTYGIIEYAGVWLVRFLITGNLPSLGIPASLEPLTLELIAGMLRPLEIFSLAMLIVGFILILVSFIYKRGGSKPVTEKAATEYQGNSPV